MAKTIWKYPFPIHDSFELEMPRGAKVLSVQVQGGKPCLWAEVNENGFDETRYFEVRGTGHTLIGNEGRFIGTIQLMEGALVFHIYEKLKGG